MIARQSHGLMDIGREVHGRDGAYPQLESRLDLRESRPEVYEEGSP